LFPIDDFGLLGDLKGVCGEGDHACVRRADEHEVGRERHTAVVRSAGVHALDIFPLWVVASFLSARARVEREHSALVGRDVERSLEDQRGSLHAAVVTARRERPGRVEPVDVGQSDLRKPDEALAVVAAAVSEFRRE
jgi:hypothetical protein